MNNYDKKTYFKSKGFAVGTELRQQKLSFHAPFALLEMTATEQFT